jgi:glycosyltransferase involved in cell wall biosynthesis
VNRELTSGQRATGNGRRVFICLPALDHGDALSHFAVMVAEALRRFGWDAQILAPIVHPAMLRHGRRARRLPGDLRRDDRVLLAHSTASPWTAQIADVAAPAIMLYTGVTPPELCEPRAPHLVGPLRKAQADLAAIAPRLAGAICTSRTAATELADLTGGTVKSAVVPLVIDESLYPVDEQALSRPVGRPPRLLVVGRVAPHKRVEEALAIHTHVQRTLDPDVHLDIVGDITLCPDYVEWLCAWPSGAALAAPRLCGKVPFEHLLARYREADVLLFLSAHEGFGVPLLEAMWLGVPIVAAACPGTVETLDGAGLIANHRHIVGLAELVELVLTDDALRRRLIAAGRERAKHFSVATLEERLKAAWAAVAQSL